MGTGRRLREVFGCSCVGGEDLVSAGWDTGGGDFGSGWVTGGGDLGGVLVAGGGDFVLDIGDGSCLKIKFKNVPLVTLYCQHTIPKYKMFKLNTTTSFFPCLYFPCLYSPSSLCHFYVMQSNCLYI